MISVSLRSWTCEELHIFFKRFYCFPPCFYHGQFFFSIQSFFSTSLFLSFDQIRNCCCYLNLSLENLQSIFFFMAAFASVINLPNLHTISIRLDRTNYSFWKIQILPTVRAHGLDDLTDKFKLPPPQLLPSSSGDCVANPDFLTWIRRDQYLVSWLLSSIGESMLGHATRCITPRDIWIVLRKFVSITVKGSHNAVSTSAPNTEERITIFRCILPENAWISGSTSCCRKTNCWWWSYFTHPWWFHGLEFDAVVVNITNRTDNLNLQEVQFAFQAHEIRLENQISFTYPSANVSYHQSTARNFNIDNSQSGGKGQLQFCQCSSWWKVFWLQRPWWWPYEL